MEKEQWIEHYEEDLKEEWKCCGAEDDYGRSPEGFNQFCEDSFEVNKEDLEDEFEANKALAEKQEQDFEMWKGN